MNTKKRLSIMVLTSLAICMASAGLTTEVTSVTQTKYSSDSQSSFQGPESFFSGKVQVDMLFPENDTAGFSGAYVTFQPGARTAWHMHPAGQHMIVTQGTALTGTRDGKVIEFSAGETVWCPAAIDHWHGATADAPMTHLVITGSKDGENVIWKEQVSDVQYYRTGNKEKTQQKLKELTLKQQRIVVVAAFAAKGDESSLKAALYDALQAGLSINELKEELIHLYAYVGFPRALNGLTVLMTVVNERKEKGIDDAPGEQATDMPAGISMLETGKKVQTDLVGHPVSGPLFEFAPDINVLLQSHLFGDLFGRGILTYQSREMITIAALSSINGVGSQLNSHIAIAVNTGITAAQLEDIAVVLEMNVGKSEASRMKQAVNKVSSE